MKIKWMGHACFLLTSEGGTRILTDSFDVNDKRIGYPPPSVEADIVTTSHQHFDHNCIDLVKGDYTHIDGAGTFALHGVEINGIETFHDDAGGSSRGKNIMYKFNIDGIRVCHCGDLGHLLTPEQLELLGEVDVLLLPVGGTYTINGREAVKVVESIQPVITIPMHFKTPILDFDIDGVDRFLAAAGGGEKLDRQEIEIKPDGLAAYSDIIVLDYPKRA